MTGGSRSGCYSGRGARCAAGWTPRSIATSPTSPRTRRSCSTTPASCWSASTTSQRSNSALRRRGRTRFCSGAGFPSWRDWICAPCTQVTTISSCYRSRSEGTKARRRGPSLGSGESGRVAPSAGGVECGDADCPAEGDRTAHFGAADRRLAAVRRVAQSEARQLHAGVNSSPFDLQARCGDSIVEARDLPIESRQLALADDIHEAGPSLAIEGVVFRGVALSRPVGVGRPRPLGEGEQSPDEHVLDPTLPAQRLRPQIRLNPHDVCAAVVGEPVLAGEHGGVQRIASAVEAGGAGGVGRKEDGTLGQGAAGPPRQAELIPGRASRESAKKIV